MSSIKYFFGWKLTNGILYPLMWEETDGICVGGKRDIVQQHELKREVYEKPNWKWLEKNYPYLKPDPS